MHRTGIFLVAGISCTHVAATQLVARTLDLQDISPFFLMWISTGWNVLLIAPYKTMYVSAQEPWIDRPAQLIAAVAPFYLLWAGANLLYVQALATISSSLVLGIFSVTPAFVAILAVPLLNRQLTAASLIAVTLSGVGVAVIAKPWALDDGSNGGSLVIGCVEVLGAAFCAAMYKVIFKRVFGDASMRLVLLVLAILGCWSLSAGTAAVGAITPQSFSQMPTLSGTVWGMLIGRGALDVLFNFLIAIGLAVTNPIFISVGTLLSTPLNILLEWAWHGATPSGLECAGIVAIGAGFLVIMLDDYKRVSNHNEHEHAALRDGQQAHDSGVHTSPSVGLASAQSRVSRS